MKKITMMVFVFTLLSFSGFLYAVVDTPDDIIVEPELRVVDEQQVLLYLQEFNNDVQAFFNAALEGRDDVIYYLHRYRNFNLNTLDTEGKTALFYAIESIYASYDERLNVINTLIELGADVDHTDAQGAFPIWLAYKNNNFSILEKLVSAGADINVQDVDGNTFLHRAVGEDYSEVNEDNKYLSKLMVQVLVDVGIDLNLQDYTAIRH